MSEARIPISRRWRNIASALICILIAVLAYFYAKPISYLVYAKWQCRNNTRLWTVPIPLRLENATHEAGRRMSYFGYEFESPWTDLSLERKYNSVVMLYFSNGQFVSIFDPAHDFDELQLMKQVTSARGASLANVVGEDAASSRYQLQSWIWNLTPGDLRLFSSRQKMVTNSVFLIMKKIWMERLKGGLYSFQTSWLRGIQEGAPSLDDAVIISAFDPQDRKIEIWVGSTKSARHRPSQDDINRILCTLRPVAKSEAK